MKIAMMMCKVGLMRSEANLQKQYKGRPDLQCCDSLML